jgi:NAD-dependent SIR2 family protein deacetylase
VVFFGESIPQYIKEKSFREIEGCNKVLLIGTTLATYSAFRVVRHALELKKPVMLLNVGPSRADLLSGVEKIDMPSGSVMREVARAVIGTRAFKDPIVKDMLQSGIVRPPALDDNDRSH